MINQLLSLLPIDIPSYYKSLRQTYSLQGCCRLMKIGLLELKSCIVAIVTTLLITHRELDTTANCPICLNKVNPSNGVVAEQCNHPFCGECIFDYWKHNTHHQMKCPYCRQKISSFCKTFRVYSPLSYDFIIKYNFLYGNVRMLQPFQIITNTYRSVRQLVKQIIDLCKLLTNLSLMLLLTLLTLYVLSPIDLLPELYLGLLGLVDDILCIFFILWIVFTLTLLR